MTWKSETGDNFDNMYSKNPELHSLYKFAMALVLESDSPQNLPLMINNPAKKNYFMQNLQDTHCLIFRVDENSQTIEFVYCR